MTRRQSSPERCFVRQTIAGWRGACPAKQERVPKKDKSPARRGPIIVTVEFEDRIDIWTSEALRRQFQLVVAHGLSIFAGATGFDRGDPHRKRRREEFLAALEGLDALTGMPGTRRIRLTNRQAKSIMDAVLVAALQATPQTHPKVREALREVLPILPEGLLVYFRTPPLPELSEVLLRTATLDEAENYRRLREFAPQRRCPVCYGGVARLAQWLSRLSAQVFELRIVAGQMREMARPYLAAEWHLATLQ